MNFRVLGTVAAALALADCSHGPKAPPVSAAVRAAPSSEVDAIVQMLDRGERDPARKRVRGALKRDPANASLRVLADSIDHDPKDLLGPQSFPYTVRSGETMIGLAERFLGNRLKAYQLARYNGIDVPRTLTAGQVLRIPGEPPRIELPRKLPSAPSPHPAPVARAKPAAAPKPVAPLVNPAAAQRLRAAGLAALNGGAPVRAVVALRRAAALDPGNSLIARDLARAERIAATVRARR
ncbi:LysM peptidoglycan-binding domain-containing protein [Sphingomonas sp.]|uniref:LysM peptidoglycan-binding domain-containing protein n=1 Tax=Sphingomonas sp. TaxID=28214 RepID=UPI0035BC142F